MLKLAIQKFELTAEAWKDHSPMSEIDIEIACYKNWLVENGYLLRKDTVTYEDSAEQSVCLAGVLGFSSALEDAHTANAEKYLEAIKRNLRGPIVACYYDVLPDFHYCRHTTWNQLTLVNDHVSNVPSLVCGECGGIAANYRLNLNPDIAAMLWDWERHCDAISDLSSLCGDYEEWADHELSDLSSRLNQKGIALAHDLSKALGIEVEYHYNMEYQGSMCPACKQKLVKREGVFRKCNQCRVVFG